MLTYHRPCPAKIAVLSIFFSSYKSKLECTCIILSEKGKSGCLYFGGAKKMFKKF